MVNTVLKEESFLFTDEELDVLRSYSALSCASLLLCCFQNEIQCHMVDNARYLLVRLVLRKPGQWFRVDKLKYISELGEQGIQEAIVELCKFPNYKPSASNPPRGKSVPPTDKASQRDTEIIDLTLDSEDEEPVAGPSRPSTLKHTASEPISMSSQSTEKPSIFAVDESHATLDELVSCLNVDELKSIARLMKIAKPPPTVSVRKKKSIFVNPA